jgi:hypothetical protein
MTTKITQEQAVALNLLSQEIATARREAKSVISRAQDIIENIDNFKHLTSGFSALSQDDKRLEQSVAKAEVLSQVLGGLGVPESAMRRAFEATDSIRTWFTEGDDFGTEA